MTSVALLAPRVVSQFFCTKNLDSRIVFSIFEGISIMLSISSQFFIAYLSRHELEYIDNDRRPSRLVSE